MQIGKHSKYVFAAEIDGAQVPALTRRATLEQFSFSIGWKMTLITREKTIMDSNILKDVSELKQWKDRCLQKIKKEGVCEKAASELAECWADNKEEINNAAGKKAPPKTNPKNVLTEQQQEANDEIDQKRKEVDAREKQLVTDQMSHLRKETQLAQEQNRVYKSMLDEREVYHQQNTKSSLAMQAQQEKLGDTFQKKVQQETLNQANVTAKQMEYHSYVQQQQQMTQKMTNTVVEKTLLCMQHFPQLMMQQQPALMPPQGASVYEMPNLPIRPPVMALP